MASTTGSLAARPLGTSEPVDVDVVVLVDSFDATLGHTIESVHAHLLDRGPARWLLTLADRSAGEDTRPPLEGLVARLPHTRVVAVERDLTRHELRASWANSAADAVAFVSLQPGADVGTLLAPVVQRAVVRRPGDDTSSSQAGRPRSLLSRRAALLGLGGLGVAAVLAACGGSSSPSGSASATTSATTGGATSSTAGSTSATSVGTTVGSSATTTGSVVLAPEMTQGPYYLDLDLVRSDVREDRQGAAFDLGLAVVEASSGAPVHGASVDIWHADGDGLYSGFVSQSASANGASSSADDGTFLRGTQVTDGNGRVAFTTIYPGWYTGRTVHIHVMVHVDGKTVHTGQLFFDDNFTDQVFAAKAPYSSRSARPVRNADDDIYAGGGAQSTLDVASSGSGYAATMTMGVQTS